MTSPSGKEQEILGIHRLLVRRKRLASCALTASILSLGDIYETT
jgi:hypothetical protein